MKLYDIFKIKELLLFFKQLSFILFKLPGIAIIIRLIKKFADLLPSDNYNSTRLYSPYLLYPVVFDWTLKDFQEIYNNSNSTRSGLFVLPPTDSIKNISSKSQPIHRWRIYLKTHQNQKQTYISLFLEANKTKFEQTHGLQARIAKWKFEMFRIIDAKNIKKCAEKVAEHEFQLSSRNPNWGWSEFCELNVIFPNGTVSEKTDLLIRIHFFDPYENAPVIHPMSLLSRSLEDYFNNEAFSDITFTFNCGSKLYASRLVLTLRSPFYKAMFSGSWVETTTSTIHVQDASFECFHAMFYFLYTNKLQEGLSFTILKELYYEADMRDMVDLAKLVVFKVAGMINSENFDDVFMMAYQTENIWLRAKVINFVFSHFDDLWTCEGIKRIIETGNVPDISKMLEKRFLLIKNHN
ncbi:14444_t:CDS:2 [Dentiscutata erythropus]|uniref:14444_t:CDS:1 n=1 Tax=Dentiscutata erythropus TaxID=1348616 RepID=A0A9N9I0S7_9GLOM|nr:14444_t:CDS:2 [Dentiscutata erythropus]